MSLRADGNGDYAIRTAGGFYALDVMTVCFWAQLLADNNASSALFGLRTDGGQYTYFYNVNNDGTTFVWESFPNTVGSIDMAVNTWYFCAISRAGSGSNQTNGYVRAASASSFTTSQATFSHADTPMEEIVLANGFSPTDSSFPGRIAALKQWDAALTADELMAESYSLAPVRLANLHSWRPFVDSSVAAAVIDYSGNGRNLTANGSLLIADGPPIAWRRGTSKTFIPIAGGAETQTITATGIASEEAFGSDTLTPGAVTVSPSGIASAEAFGPASLNLTVAPSGIATAEAFGTDSVNLNLAASGIASAEAFGTAILTTAYTISGTGIASAEAFGSQVISAGALILGPSGIASGEIFGSHTLAPGAVTLSASGVATGEAFGDHVVSAGGLIVSASGIASAEAFGSHTLTPGAVSIAPSGIASGEAFGSHALAATFTITAQGVGSAEAFGDPELALGAAVLSPLGIASAEAFGTALLSGGGSPLALRIDYQGFAVSWIDDRSIASSWVDNRSIDLE